MKIQEILELERENRDTCYLIKDGMFWRAWEKSAFIFVKNIKNYSLTKKFFKISNDYAVYLGFPGKSLTEIMNSTDTKEHIVIVNENLIEIKGFTITDDFDLWKNDIPVYKNGVNPVIFQEADPEYKKINLNSSPEHDKIMWLYDRIQKFPIAERTPLDCQKFIIELQNIINGTI